MPRLCSSVGGPSLSTVTASPLAGVLRGVPPRVGFHPSFECGNSDALSRLVIVGRFSMGTPTKWRDCSLTSAAIERTDIYGGKLSEPHQSGPLPPQPVIGQSPALAVWQVA
jgi:hypothetical protein